MIHEKLCRQIAASFRRLRGNDAAVRGLDHGNRWISVSNSRRLIVVTLALVVPIRPRLLDTTSHTTELLFGTVRNAQSALDGNVGATMLFALLAGGAVGAAETGLFDILGASRMFALFALGAMGNAKTSLDDRVGAVLDAAGFALSFAWSLG